MVRASVACRRNLRFLVNNPLCFIEVARQLTSLPNSDEILIISAMK